MDLDETENDKVTCPECGSEEWDGTECSDCGNGKEICPECGSEEWDGTECSDCGNGGYSELCCPFCGEIVDWIGQNSQMDPCPCVVAWCNYGDCLEWEDLEFKRRLYELALALPDDNEDLLEAGLDGFDPDISMIQGIYKDDPNVIVESHDDGAPHGHSSGSWFVFVRRNEEK